MKKIAVIIPFVLLLSACATKHTRRPQRYPVRNLP